MTPDEARRVLVAARETAQTEQWQAVYDLLFPVHEEKVLTGTEQGDAAFLLGEACRGLESWDAAAYYYEAASTSASADDQGKAKERLAEIRRQDAAVDAEYEGVVQGEADAVLAAADDALARHDFDDALAHYRAAWAGVVDGKPKYRAALGIARSCANLGNHDEASQYADYVVDSAPADLADQAKSLLEWIKDHRAATAASADGTSPDEFRESWDAANGAYFGGACTTKPSPCTSPRRTPSSCQGRTGARWRSTPACASASSATRPKRRRCSSSRSPTRRRPQSPRRRPRSRRSSGESPPPNWSPSSPTTSAARPTAQAGMRWT